MSVHNHSESSNVGSGASGGGGLWSGLRSRSKYIK